MRGNKQVGGAARRGLAHADVLTMDVDIDVAVGGWRRVVGERVLVVVLERREVVLHVGNISVRVQRITGGRRERAEVVRACPSRLVMMGWELVCDAWGLLGIVHRIG